MDVPGICHRERDRLMRSSRRSANFWRQISLDHVHIASHARESYRGHIICPLDWINRHPCQAGALSTEAWKCYVGLQTYLSPPKSVSCLLSIVCGMMRCVVMDVLSLLCSPGLMTSPRQRDRNRLVWFGFQVAVVCQVSARTKFGTAQTFVDVHKHPCRAHIHLKHRQ